MNNIEALIAQLCPEGVEFRELREVISALRTGLNPRQNFKLNSPDAKHYYITVRELIGFSIHVTGKTDRVNPVGLRLIQNRSKIQLGDILFSGTGTIGRTALVTDTPNNWNIKEGIYVITPIVDLINARFLIYLIQSSQINNQILAKADGSTVASISMSSLRKIAIPLPPLPIQLEIVNILDKFTTLQAELQAELQARRAQYEYYRNELLNFEGKEAEWKMLGEVSKILRGTSMTKRETIPGKFPVVANSPNPIYLHGKSNRSGETIVIARSGAYSGLVTYWNIPFFLTDAFSIHPDNTLLNTKFVYFLLKREQDKIHLMKKGSGVPHVRANDFESYSIPIPPLAEQNRIVAILDKFDKLVNDISEGLPAEIQARRKQYEYYRGKLLEFRPIQN